MASHQPARREPQSSSGPVRLDRADCVRATAGVEPAPLAEERAHEVAVSLDRNDEQAAGHRPGRGGSHRGGSHWSGGHRRNAASRSAASCGPVEVAAAGNTRTTTRAPAGKVANRDAIRCRSWRRIRLRTTAPPTARPTTNPARGGPGVGSGVGTGVGSGVGTGVGSAVGTELRVESAAPAASASKRWTTRRGRAARRPDRAAAAKSERCRSRDAAGSTRDPGRRAASGRKALTALPAARGKNGATSARAHPQPESMGLGSPTVIRLERTLAHSRAPEREIERRVNGPERCTKREMSSSRSQGPPTVRADRRDGQTWSGPRNRLAVTCDHRLSPPSPGVTCPQRLGSLPSQVICRSGLLVVENSLKHRVARC
jgi:hypothetical protein